MKDLYGDGLMRVGSNDKPVRRCFSTNLYGEALEWLICVWILYKPLELLKLYGDGCEMAHA